MSSRRIFRDVEEAISREVRRITFFDPRTESLTVLQDTFDPFTGEIVPINIEPTFYDSSSDAQQIQYPHFFIRLMKTREDRFSKRVIPQYGNNFLEPDPTTPPAYEIITQDVDGAIAAPGNVFNTSLFQIRKVQPNQLLRVVGPSNQGTYIISSVTPNNTGIHDITVSGVIAKNLPEIFYESSTGQVRFTAPVDLNTVKVNDLFVDASSVSYTILSVSVPTASVYIATGLTPDLAINSQIHRTGNVFTSTGSSLVFLILDPTQPVEISVAEGIDTGFSEFQAYDNAVPLDLFYMVRIDSKERDTHIDIINRMWEEFNPPRTALPTVVRGATSDDQALTADVSTGGSNTITIADNSKYGLGDTIYIINDFHPTKLANGMGFERPFQSTIAQIVGTTQLVLADVVPDMYTVASNSIITSNAEFRLFMFHFVDHVTRDVEGAQYWVHEFSFWIQVWVDRLGTPEAQPAVTQISETVEIIEP